MGTRVMPVCVLDKSPLKRSPSGTHFPLSSSAVSGQRLSFSISKILGLESDSSLRQSSPNSGKFTSYLQIATYVSLSSIRSDEGRNAFFQNITSM